jgi:hypothetical protein
LTFAAGSGAQTAAAIAFVDVDVVPMDREPVLRRQTVVVQGDRIVAIGPAAEIAVPEGAVRIAGRDGDRSQEYGTASFLPRSFARSPASWPTVRHRKK